ncbi:MAG: sulfatase-like hydrolase/transferase [Planctomycetes bacterium]|nr:sulfatase-like hydrolase/transferase [Planctomycetota bacterium]
MNKLSTILTLLFSFSFAALNALERPNILWIVTEDNGHHWVGAYGDPLARTPHIDMLAAAGNLYHYVYSNAPVCAVARSMLLTGMYSTSLGTHNMRSRYRIPTSVRPYVDYMREAGYYCTNNSKTDYNIQFEKTGGQKKGDAQWWDESSSRAHYKNGPKDKPFFAVFNIGTSHESNLFTKKLESHRKDGNIPQTPKTDLSAIKLPSYLPNRPEILQDWATYYDLMEYTDSLVGNRLKELEALGHADDTIIIHYSDHGGILPRAKRFTYDTGTHVPFVAYFPKKWEHLSAVQQGTSTDEVVGFIDLPPTLLSLAGIPIPDHMQGRAFAGEQRSEPETEYAFLFGQRFDATYFNFVRGVTNGKYRYLRNFHSMRPRYMQTGYAYGQKGWQAYKDAWKKGELNPQQASYWTGPQPVEELYHTASDPWEINNLAADPKYQKLLKKMRRATLAKMRAIRDTGVVPEPMYRVIAGDKTLHEAVQSTSFDYNRILDFVVPATARNPKNLHKLEAGLNDENPIIRYWSAFGCTMIGEKAKLALPKLKKLLNDPDETVRMAAGRAVAELGDRDAGIPVILSMLKNSEEEIMKVEAFQNLDELHAISNSMLKTLSDKKNDPKGYLTRIVSDYRTRISGESSR